MRSFATNPSYGLVLLAAGASSRMGQPKQLLPIHGKPLLRHVAEIALSAPVSPVVIVLGANAAQIKPTLDGLALHVIVNAAWRDGMASSLRAGIQARYEAEITPWFATARLWDDGVIDPRDTRTVLGLALETTLNAPIEESNFGVLRM